MQTEMPAFFVGKTAHEATKGVDQMAIEYLTPKQLKQSRSCERYGQLARLHLGGEYDADSDRRRCVKGRLIDSLQKEDMDAALNAWNKFMDNEYAYLPEVISSESGDLIRRKGERFIRWFYEKGYSVSTKFTRYSFSFRDILIKGTSDMVLKDKEGKTVYMDVSFSRNPYSDKARKEESLTSNSIELLCRMAVACYEKADCCIAYLTSKDDTASRLADEFEKKPGKNVAYLSAYDYDEADLERAVSILQKKDCRNCSQYALCNTKAYERGERTNRKRHKDDGGASVLTDVQKEAAGHIKGPMCVLSVPGSGKTRVILENILTLIESGVDASEIVAVTFTRKACAELLERVRGRIRDSSLPSILTFHSLAYTIISEQEGSKMPDRLATTLARVSLIKEAVKQGPFISGISYEYPAADTPGSLYRRLDLAFAFLRDNDISAYPFDGDKDALYECYKIYEKLYADGGYYSYDDMIPLAAGILRKKGVLTKYQKRWRYFLADEYQDVSKDQAELLYLLAGKERNITVVGDDDQSIYEWRKGSPEFLLNFGKQYPDAKTLYMEDNFRTTGRILASAQSLIINNDVRYGKVINPTKEAGYPVYYGEEFTDEMLVRFLKSQTAFDPSDVCILARNNKTLDRIEEAMAKEGLKALPSRSYLRDTQLFGMLRCFLTFARDGFETAEVVLYRLLKYMDIEPELTEEGLYEKYFSDEDEIPQIRAALKCLNTDEHAEAVIREVLKALGCAASDAAFITLIDSVIEERCRTWQEVLCMMENMEKLKDDTEVELSPKAGFYNLVTSHKSKGKEYPFVVIVQVEDYDDTPQERNLLYVSMTRAKKVLVIIKSSLKPAPLIDEIEGMVPLTVQKGA